VDVAVSKRFSVAERQTLAVRAEAFNLFNRTHFGVPVRILDTPAFGSSVSTTIPARIVQIGVRYSF
jgi:hypothetical protein